MILRRFNSDYLCKVFEPQFEGQTKTKLGNRGYIAVSWAVSEMLENYLEEHPNEAKIIVDKVVWQHKLDMQQKS